MSGFAVAREAWESARVRWLTARARLRYRQVMRCLADDLRGEGLSEGEVRLLFRQAWGGRVRARSIRGKTAGGCDA